MKRYNLSQIMKRAHNLYNNARAKYPTFSDALRKSWSGTHERRDSSTQRGYLL